MSQITEHKETLMKLNEPYKLKLVPYAKGYQLEITANLSSGQVDGMLNPDGEIVQLIENGKKLITETLGATILKVEVDKIKDSVKLEKDQKIKKEVK